VAYCIAGATIRGPGTDATGTSVEDSRLRRICGAMRSASAREPPMLSWLLSGNMRPVPVHVAGLLVAEGVVAIGKWASENLATTATSTAFVFCRCASNSAAAAAELFNHGLPENAAGFSHANASHRRSP
jgi:hypothetical protein